MQERQIIILNLWRYLSPSSLSSSITTIYTSCEVLMLLKVGHHVPIFILCYSCNGANIWAALMTWEVFYTCLSLQATSPFTSVLLSERIMKTSLLKLCEHGSKLCFSSCRLWLGDKRSISSISVVYKRTVLTFNLLGSLGQSHTLLILVTRWIYGILWGDSVILLQLLTVCWGAAVNNKIILVVGGRCIAKFLSF